MKDLITEIVSEAKTEKLDEILRTMNVGKQSIDSYTWGIDCIDNRITTPKKGKVIVLVSDENSGKSTFCYFFARKNALRYGHNVVYFNLEQTKEEVINDMAIQYCGASKIDVRDNKHLENSLYLKRKNELETQEDIVFIGRKAENVTTMREIKARIAETGQLDYLILDNLTCISGEGANRNDQTKNIALELIHLAQVLDIPIVLVHHYKKREKGTKGVFRDVHDMEGSGSLKNLVPIVIQVARHPDPTNEREEAEFYIREGKLRGGIKKETIVIHHQKGEFIEQVYPGFDGK